MSSPSVSKPALSILGTVAGAALISSCALVLGFEDREPYPSGSGGSSSSSSSSGLSGSGGSSSASSSSGTGGASHFGDAMIIASGQAGPSDITFDNAGIYWVNRGLAVGQEQIWSLAKSSTQPFEIAHMQGDLRGIAVDALNVWCAEDWPSSGYSTISRFPKNVDTGVFPAEPYTVNGGMQLSAIALQGTVLAWSSGESGGSVWRGDTQGSAQSMLAMNQGVVTSIVLDGGTTYWVSAQQGAVIKNSGGTTQPFALQTMPTSVAVDTDNVYWTGNDGTVKMLSKASPGGQPVVLASDAISPQAIAVDETYVYWAESNAGGLVRAAPRSGGGKVETIAEGQYPFGVAVDADAVYATMQGDGTNGTVIQIPKQ